MSSGGVATHMAHAHGPLARTNTAPVFPSRSAGNGLPGLSQTMSHTSRSSQLSTAFMSSSSSSLSSVSMSMSSSSTLVNPQQMAVNGGPVVATNNIINQRADASRSLYQICVGLRQRLEQVPGFEPHLEGCDVGENGKKLDPVESLWELLKKGTPLMTIYNSLQPEVELRIEKRPGAVQQPKNQGKMATFKFVEACLQVLKIPPGECFQIGDLYGTDTTGFVKVCQVINMVLDEAEQRGFLMTSQKDDTVPAPTMAGSQMTYRDHVVQELVDTERKYVQDLENLHELKKTIEQKAVIPGDVVHDIFLNINAILDFQRRFLIKIETTNSEPDETQRWGEPFVELEEGFVIYQPFIANQRKAASIAKRDFDKLAVADHPVVVDFNTLDGFLLKPMQRLVKYPLLLKDLRDKTGADDETKDGLTAGIEAANRVLTLANSAVDRELRHEAYEDLVSRVDDWKNHKPDQFGELLLHGHFPVLTGKSDVQKEYMQYTIYLFESILLCCKDSNPNKSKDKLIGKDKKDKNKNKGPDKNARLHLKGRIFMTNVTEVLSLGKQGSYTVQIFWKGDPGVENFIIKFSNEESMKKWYAGVDAQRKAFAAPSQSNTSPDAPEATFTWMRDQTQPIPNPYQEDDDDDDDYPPQPPPISQSNSTYPGPMPGMNRNASSTSLRSRSTTGDSSQSTTRGAPPRFPMNMNMPNPPAPLSLQTQGHLPSPSQRLGDSYFSPVGESPASSRTSTTSGMFPFPRQGTPQSGWENPDYSRYTAPAMPRAPSRGSQTPSDAYQMNGRTPQRPSLPAMASQTSQAQQRSRSYSTPDINAQNGGRRLPNGAVSNQVPAVPGIPAHLHPAYDAGIPRSQNNSPGTNGLPIRSNTQSPGVQRERLVQQSQYPQAQYPPSQYSRSNPAQLSLNHVDSRTMSPPLVTPMSGDSDMGLPTQLKVKVNCEPNYVTLVVAFNITYQSLIDRIDAKVGRFSNNAIARGTMRLRYRDEDGDFVTIESDDDIQIAFQEWREAQKQQYHTGQLGEIELFCSNIDN